MTLDLQYKIKSDPRLNQYLKENAKWYKYLNRDPLLFNEFVKEMKDKYQLKPSDRFNKMINNINLLQTFLDVLK